MKYTSTVITELTYMVFKFLTDISYTLIDEILQHDTFVENTIGIFVYFVNVMYEMINKACIMFRPMSSRHFFFQVSGIHWRGAVA